MRIHHFLFLAMLTGICGCKEIPTEPILDWTQLSDFPGPARASATSFVVGQNAYVCLGRTALKSGFLKDLWVFDSQATSPDSVWIRKTDFPGLPRVKAIAGVIGKIAYVGMGAIGPYDINNQYNDFWAYDTEHDTWSRKKDFPGVGRNDLFCAVVNNALYVTMGYSSIRWEYETWKYDPLTDEWTQMPDSPYDASGVAGFSLGNSFYVGSGFTGYNRKVLYRFQPDNQSWTRMTDLPKGRTLSSSLAIDGKGYILLGRYWNGAQNGGGLLSDIIEYNPASNTWTERGLFPGGARQNALAFSIGENGYVLMGEDESTCKPDVWVFRP